MAVIAARGDRQVEGRGHATGQFDDAGVGPTLDGSGTGIVVMADGLDLHRRQLPVLRDRRAELGVIVFQCLPNGWTRSCAPSASAMTAR